MSAALFNAHINVLTNYQRNQWARAGYPGLAKKDVAALRQFFGGFFNRYEERHGTIEVPRMSEWARETYSVARTAWTAIYSAWRAVRECVYHPTKGWRTRSL